MVHECLYEGHILRRVQDIDMVHLPFKVIITTITNINTLAHMCHCVVR